MRSAGYIFDSPRAKKIVDALDQLSSDDLRIIAIVALGLLGGQDAREAGGVRRGLRRALFDKGKLLERVAGNRGDLPPMSKNTKAGMEQNKNKVSAAIAGGTLPLPEILAPLVGVHERTIRRYLEELEVNISDPEVRQRGALAILGMIADKLDELENDHLIRKMSPGSGAAS